MSLGEGARPATADDLSRVAELAELLVAELTQLRGGAVWAVRERELPTDALDRLLDERDRTLVVGTVDDVIVGYGTARAETLSDGRAHGVIDEIFVEPEARSIGVGETILTELLAFLRARQCRGFDALALPGHRATKNFFEEAGFTARLLVLHKSE